MISKLSLSNFKTGMAPFFTSLAISLYFCLLLMFAATGPLRTITGISINLALYLLAIPTLIAAYLLFRYSFKFFNNQSQIIFWLLFLTIIYCFSWLQLFNEDFQGFPGYHTSDPANHLHYRNEFISHNPNAYYKFTSLYALSYWLEKIYAEHSLFAWRDAFYLSLLGCYLCWALIGYAISRKSLLRKEDLLTLAITSGGAIAILHWILLPLINYHQIDGFYAHLFSLLPLMICWTIYALVDSVYWRYLLFLPLIVFYRFTYGLNLPDLILSLSILSLIDFYLSQNKDRRGLTITIILLLAASAGYVTLAPSMKVAGAIIKTDLNTLSAILLIASLAALTTAFRLKTSAPQLNSLDIERIKRMIIFPAIFSSVSVLALTFLRLLGYTSNYYPFKYLLLASLLMSLLFCLAIYCQLTITLTLIQRSERTTKYQLSNVLLCGLILLTTSVALAYIHVPLFPIYQERITRPSVYRHLAPLTDKEGEQVIRQILKFTGKKFGGYLIEHWPRYSYVNVSFGLRPFYEDYQKATFIQKNGYCIFWEHPLRKRNMDLHGAHNALVKIKKITQAGPYHVFAYTRSEGRPKPRMIAYKCY